MKALKALVIGMGILILLGLAVVIAAIVARMGNSGEGARAAFGTLHLGLPESCRIAAARPLQDRLVLRLAGPRKDGCGEVIVVDPEAGRVVGRIAPGAAPGVPQSGEASP